MPIQIKTRHCLMAMIPVAIAVTTVAWQNSGAVNTNPPEHQLQDTVPSKHEHQEFRDKDLRDEKDLDKATFKLDKALKRIDANMEKIDWDKIQEQIEASMDKVNEEMRIHSLDMKTIQAQVDKAMKNVDWEKINEETSRVMQHLKENIDIDQINEEVRRGLTAAKEQLDSRDFLESAEAATRLTTDEISKALEEAKEELEKNKVDLHQQMDIAKEGVKKAKEELKGHRELIKGLEKDGLIDTQKDYRIEFKNNELFIDGKKQSPEITGKYKGYFKNDNTRIYKKNGRFNIDSD